MSNSPQSCDIDATINSIHGGVMRGGYAHSNTIQMLARTSMLKRANLLLDIASAKLAPGHIMKYLHTMVRITDIESSLRFYRDALGLIELSRRDYTQGRYTLVFLAAPGDERCQVELTHNWDPEVYGGGRNFGHLAYAVQDIYAACRRMMDHGVTINRPPRDGRMAFVRSPDGISIELLQQGAALPPAEPWTSMPNSGVW